MSQDGNAQIPSPQTPAPGNSAAVLLQRVREAGISSAAALCKQALDGVDDALFGFSEKSDSTTARSQFMDAMRNIRIKRPAIEQTFREQLANRFLDFARLRGQGAAAATQEIQSDSLALVEENDLEEDLAVDGMAAKAKIRHNSALYAFNQRLAVVVGAKEVLDDGNPLGPTSVCQALKATMKQFDADVTVKLVILKLFDRHVVTDLDQVYDATNRVLAEAGVLPNIKYTRPARAPGETPPPKPAAVAPAVTDGEMTQESEEDAASTNEVMSAISTLFANRRRQAGGDAVRRAAGPSISNSELIAALTRLQTQTPGLEFNDDAETPAERVERVKHDLIDQLRQLGISQPDQRVATADEDAIDLVGMLFQFVVQDRNLPAEVQAILSRMQIPYVRVALKDKHLFAQKVHPARQLLNTLAVAGVGWSKEGDRDARFLTAMTQTVERVVNEFADDFSLFTKLNAEFEVVLEQQKKHTEVAEQRTADAASGREKLAQARHLVAQIVSSRIGKHPLPSLVRDVILNPWTNFMVLTHLRQGPASSEWKSAVNFVDAVAWSSLPKREEKDYVRLRGLLPQMLIFLRRGLNVVGFSESDAEGLVKGFGVLLESMHQREVSLETTAAVTAAEQAIASVNLAQAPGARAEDGPAAAVGPEPALPEDDEFLVRVRAMKVGTWVEFETGGGARERAKLSWISPFSARFLFVNRKGLKVAERSVFVLANELRAGTAYLLEVAPIFDRALDSIMTRLKEEHLQAGGAPPNQAAPKSTSEPNARTSPASASAAGGSSPTVRPIR